MLNEVYRAIVPVRLESVLISVVASDGSVGSSGVDCDCSEDLTCANCVISDDGGGEL